MDIAGMQPYLFPYLGYFQLINCADCFVIADNMQFINQGWINRNKILLQDKEHRITFPIKKDSAFLKINERYFLNDTDQRDTKKILNLLNHAYRKAPYFDSCYSLIEGILKFENKNVANFTTNSLKELCAYLDIRTKFLIESELKMPLDLNAQERILQICKKLGADRCINAIGGVELYSGKAFEDSGVTLKFIKTNESLSYKQFNDNFVPNLSIIDVMMFNSPEDIKKLLREFELINGKD